MKKLLIAAAVLSMGIVTAHADTAFDGLYVGVDGGYGTLSPDVGDKDSAFSGGAFAGYGKTFGKIYLGGEGGFGINNTEFSDGASIYSQKYTYGATGKIGYVVSPKAIVYGLAGYERAEMEANDGTLVTKGTNDGFRFGVGTETVVRDNLTARSELGYTDWRGRDGMPKAGEWKGTIGVGLRF